MENYERIGELVKEIRDMEREVTSLSEASAKAYEAHSVASKRLGELRAEFTRLAAPLLEERLLPRPVQHAV